VSGRLLGVGLGSVRQFMGSILANCLVWFPILVNRVAKGLMRKCVVVLGEGKIQKGYELAVDDYGAEFFSRFF
jgi:hypothetical protein